MSGDGQFPPVPSGYPFPELEEEVLDRWRADRIFERSVERPAPRGIWTLYEGPPTANNAPHVGHVVTRVVKDLFPRFRTMQGYRVPRKGGWDTHGLPVEIEVEKELGFSGKREIEEFGIAEFNARCLDSVHTYERQWRAMTERVGYWTDLDDPYVTYSNEYIESVWWALSELWEKDLLTHGYKIQPYCARCGTTLSSHEVAQNYQQIDDPSIWVRFPLRAGQTVEAVDGETIDVGPEVELVAWTTTPWTTLAHVGLAVDPGMVYRIVEHPAEPGTRLVFGDDLVQPVPLEVETDGGRRRLDLRDEPVLARIRGGQLTGLRYDRPFRTGAPDRGWESPHPEFADAPPSDDHGWRVLPGDYVTAEEGTGLVHTAPPFGEDDLRTGNEYKLPFFRTVDEEGRVRAKPGTEAFAGSWFKDADADITRALAAKDRLLHADRHRHSYPFCWRCDTPLLYYATTSWFIETTRAKGRLVALNETIAWRPEHVGEGRFGNWLDNVVDWALSRSRYWGTPLPLWICEDCDAVEAVGSYAQLFDAVGRDLPDDPYDRQQFDPHRPFIDEYTWACERCGDGNMRRVEAVIDAWFDSGAMPFAQHHFPFEGRDDFDDQFPADLISEAVDQTRGWFYTLHVLGTLLFDSVAYEHCVVLGHVNDEDGRKMSKRLGNVVEPMAVIEETGADALRWYFYVNGPEKTSRFSARLVREAAQRFMLPLWNALTFFTIYANIDGWRPGGDAGAFDDRPATDRWILLRLDGVIETVTDALESYDITAAARSLEAFVDELTNWYIRRSRDRFWAGADEASSEKPSAYGTLYETLTKLARLLAPFTPFLAEVLHRHLVRSRRGESERAEASVHLESWPVPAVDRADARADGTLVRAMSAVQRIASLGRAARESHGLKTRQPLAAVTVVSADPDVERLVTPHAELLREEINVEEIRWADRRTEYVSHRVRPVFPRCGPRFGPLMPKVKRALETADGDRLVEKLERRGGFEVEIDGDTVELSRDEVEVRLEERPGMATAGDRELLVALDTELTPELVAAGLAREIVHTIQRRRKALDLDYEDRIRLRYRAGDELDDAIDEHADRIRAETLAVEMNDTGDDEDLRDSPIDGHEFAFEIEPVGKMEPETSAAAAVAD